MKVEMKNITFINEKNRIKAFKSLFEFLDINSLDFTDSVSTALKLSHCQKGFIGFVGEDESWISSLVGIEQGKLPVDLNLLSQTISFNKPTLIKNPISNPVFERDKDFFIQCNIKSFIAIPILTSVSFPIGVMILFNADDDLVQMESLNFFAENVLKSIELAGVGKDDRVDIKLNALNFIVENAIHEINNPLTIIRGYLNSLLKIKDTLPEKVEKKLSKMLDASQRVSDVVQMLRPYTLGSFEEEKVMLYDGLREVSSLFKTICQEQGIDLTVEQNWEDGRDYELVGSKTHFKQLILALLSFTRFSSSADSLQLNIEVSIEGENIVVRIWECHESSETYSEDQEFSPFSAETKLVNGSCIDLATASKLMSRTFKGKMSVRQNKSKNLVFNLEFPNSLSSEDKVAS